MNHRSTQPLGAPRYNYRNPDANLSANDRVAIKAQLLENPAMWPTKLAAMWDISLTMAKVHIQKDQEAAGYSAKSAL